MNGYEFTSFAGGLQYLSLPLMSAFFPLPFQYMAWEPEEAFTDDILKAITGMFLIVGATVGPNYIYAAQNKKTSFIDVTVWQRITWVGALIATQVLTGQDPFGDGHWPLLMTAVDWIGGIVHGVTGEGGLGGSITRLRKHYGSKCTRKALRVEAYVGMAAGIPAVVYTCLASDVKLSCLMAGVPALLYLWFSWVSHDSDKGSTGFAMMTRFIEIAALVFVAEVMAFEGVQLTLRLWYGCLLVGAVSHSLGALAVGVAGVAQYCLAYNIVQTQYVDSNGPLHWLTGWGIATIVASYVWLYLFYNSYTDAQKKRIMNTNFQDWLLGLFCPAAGSALALTGNYGPGTIGEPVGYLLPVVTLWFTLETKMLTHMWVGTPFHPTWWADGVVPRFAPQEVVNVTFGIGTALITIILTTYAWYAVVIYALGTDAMSFDVADEDLWKFACAHGMTFVWHSGMWMIFASSGTPPIRSKGFNFPPETPAPVQADVHECVKQHRKDLVIGIVFMLVGGFVLSRDDVDAAGYAAMVKMAAGALWAFCAAMKLYIHVSTFGYKHPANADKKTK